MTTQILMKKSRSQHMLLVGPWESSAMLNHNDASKFTTSIHLTRKLETAFSVSWLLDARKPSSAR